MQKSPVQRNQRLPLLVVEFRASFVLGALRVVNLAALGLNPGLLGTSQHNMAKRGDSCGIRPEMTYITKPA